MPLGEKIKFYRDKKGLTQEELGKEIGVKGATITRYEKNDRQPKLEQIAKIAKALDVSLEDLVDVRTRRVSTNDTVDKLIASLGYDILYELGSPLPGKGGRFSGATVSITNQEQHLTFTLREYINLKDDILSYLKFRLNQGPFKDDDN